MKNIILSSVVSALLLLSGCSSKEPAVDSSSSKVQEKPAQEVVAVQTETVSEDNANIETESETKIGTDKVEVDMASIEKDLSSIYFDFDKFKVREDMQENISKNSNIANDTASDYKIKLEGNCDEWGSDEYNFALGLKRANAVKKSLVAEGVDSSRITMVSYGESNPVCSENTKDCWSKNRRVDFKLLP